MKTTELNIRDPFVLVHGGKYYLYGTRSATCWGPADGFDCYVGGDLENWEGPIEIFHRPHGFFADREYWAPECVAYNGAFYLFSTFGAGNRKQGVYVLKSASPTGPFLPFGERLTPEDWNCIDGSVCFEDGIPYLSFSHSLLDIPDGEICAVRLSPDLSRAEGRPFKLFSASEAPWARPVPFARAEFGIEGDAYFTDGPYIFTADDGKLYMTWSSWSDHGYAVGAARSESGAIRGPWKQLKEPLYPENGGHGMMFRDLDGRLIFTLHYPNDKYLERPVFRQVLADKSGLRLAE